MTEYWLSDALDDGYVVTWLVAGPHAVAAREADREPQPEPALTGWPSEMDRLDDGPIWETWRCGEDRLIEFARPPADATMLRGWAACEVCIPDDAMLPCRVVTTAPADLWLNGVHVLRHEPHGWPAHAHDTVVVACRAGWNRLLLRLEAAAHDVPSLTAAVRIGDGTAYAVRVRLAYDHPVLRAKLRQIFDAARIARAVYARHDSIDVVWPADLPATLDQTIAVRLQDQHGRIVFEALPRVRAGATCHIGIGASFADGRYQVHLLPHPDAYHRLQLRVRRTIPLTVSQQPFSISPHGDAAHRRLAVLHDAAARRGELMADVARMALGQWRQLEHATVERACDAIERRSRGSEHALIALLGALLRFGSDPACPAWLVTRVRQCALGYSYDPGATSLADASESQQLLAASCELLAGQSFGELTFAGSGLRGSAHRERGAARTRHWLAQRAANGFAAWNTAEDTEAILMALSHVADLADDDELGERAAVVLDKLCFTVALSSFQGVDGASRGSSTTAAMLSACLAATAPSSWLLWGQGALNQHIRGSVALACATSYQLPDEIGEIATAQVEALWAREQHRHVSADGSVVDTVHKVTWRGSNGMLCSAQAYRPGTAGTHQHIWQATLSPDALVFVNHPASLSHDDARQPNAWRGNVVLPRVAQWHDLLIDVRCLPDDDWMGYTHAYFPTFAFDDWSMDDAWAFARVGDGYLALGSGGGMTMVTHGVTAHRELRVYGEYTVWVCQLGNAARDGDFASFQQRIRACDWQFTAPTVRGTTLRGETVTFGWDAPLVVAGVDQPLGGTLHYDSPLCRCAFDAEQMDIAGWHRVLRLQLR